MDSIVAAQQLVGGALSEPDANFGMLTSKQLLSPWSYCTILQKTQDTSSGDIAIHQNVASIFLKRNSNHPERVTWLTWLKMSLVKCFAIIYDNRKSWPVTFNNKLAFSPVYCCYIGRLQPFDIMSEHWTCGFGKECCGQTCCDYEVYADAGRALRSVWERTHSPRGGEQLLWAHKDKKKLK